MKASRRLIPIVLVGLVGSSASASVAAEPSRQVAQASSAEAKSISMPVYKPPLRGAPGGRVGGGTRGTAGRDVFVLSVLAPDHAALTISEQPTLYWYISSETALPVEFAIMDPSGTEPLLEKALPSPVTPGVHHVRLAEHDVKLAPNIAYRWSVTVIPDTNRRSRDILASGVVERVATPAQLVDKIATARKEQLPSIYAEAGIWYDALAAISDLLAAAPDDATLRQQRSALLAQAGVPEIVIDNPKRSP